MRRDEQQSIFKSFNVLLVEDGMENTYSDSLPLDVDVLRQYIDVDDERQIFGMFYLLFIYRVIDSWLSFILVIMTFHSDHLAVSESEDPFYHFRLLTAHEFVERCINRCTKWPFIANCIDVPVNPVLAGLDFKYVYVCRSRIVYDHADFVFRLLQ